MYDEENNKIDTLQNRYKLFQFNDEYNNHLQEQIISKNKEFKILQLKTYKTYEKNLREKIIALHFNDSYEELQYEKILCNTVCLLVTSQESLLNLNELQLINIDKEDTSESVLCKIKDGISDSSYDSINYPAKLFFYIRDDDINNIIKILDNTLKKYYYFYDIEKISCKSSVLVFRDIKTEVIFDGNFVHIYSEDGKEKVYFIQSEWVGDAAIQLPILYYMYLNNKLHGILYHNNKTMEFASSIVSELPFIYNKYASYLYNAENNTINFIGSKLSYFDLTCSIAQNISGISMNAPDIYDFWVKYIKEQKKYETSTLDHLRKKYKFLVGFQRTSKSNDYTKEWSIISTNNFIKKCEQESICVINFSADEYMLDCYPYSVHDVDISEIYKYAYSMDLFIGIDSFYGHLSALLSIPSISILEYKRDYTVYNLIIEGFLPIVYNYALVPKSFENNRITSEKVFAIANQILKKEKRLENKYKHLVEKKEYIHFEIV